jgi:hypothetical protein
MAAALCLAAGCGPLLGIHVLDDISSPDSGSDDGAVGDSASGASDGPASMPDATTGGADGTASDGSTASDGPTEGTTTSGYCNGLSPAPTFCADFDEGQGLTTYWSSTQGPDGSVALTNHYSVSAPNSTLFQTSSSMAYAEADFATGGLGTYTWTFDIQIVSGNTSSSADLYVGEIDFVPWSLDIEITPTLGAPGQYAIDLVETRYEADGGWDIPTHDTTGIIDAGSWTSVTLTLASSDGGASQTGSLSIDGKNVATFPIALVPWTNPAVPPYVQAGVVDNAGQDGFDWQIAVDNVTFDQQ